MVVFMITEFKDMFTAIFANVSAWSAYFLVNLSNLTEQLEFVVLCLGVLTSLFTFLWSVNRWRISLLDKKILEETNELLDD